MQGGEIDGMSSDSLRLACFVGGRRATVAGSAKRRLVRCNLFVEDS
jgi:hypothetical protein